MQRVVRFTLVGILAVAAVTACGGGGGGTEPTVPAKISASGDGQTASRLAPVATAPSFTLTDTHGHLASGVTVSFAASGDSKVSPAQATTDASGVAHVTSWTLGSTAGNYTLTATASGYPTASITATASPPKATTLSIVAGNNQTGTGLVVFATAPKVKVLDDIGAPMANVAVSFIPGPPSPGLLGTAPGDSVVGGVQNTGSDGTATLTRWVPSAIGGTHTLIATVSGLTPATFTATSTAVPISRTTDVLCVDTAALVINGTKFPQQLGRCGQVTLTTTTTLSGASGTTLLTAFVRGYQGSLAWNDGSTSAAVTRLDLSLGSGTFGNSANTVAIQGNVNTLGSAKLTDVWTMTQNGGTLSYSAFSASASQASGGAVGCNNDPQFGAITQMKQPVLLVSSCDPGQTGGLLFTSNVQSGFIANDLGVKLSITSNAGFASCAEAGSPGTNGLPVCIKGTKKFP